MNGGEISNNNCDSGGGVFVDHSTFTMNDGEISYNYAYDGGGVYLSTSTFTMSGGKISNNTGGYGGGVYVDHSTFTMNGGDYRAYIPRDHSLFYDYGGYYSGGVISRNHAGESGGGVYVSGGEFILGGMYTLGEEWDSAAGDYYFGGKISYNYAILGGGVCVESGTLTMGGVAEILGNLAHERGGGVYLDVNARFTKTGGGISGYDCFSGLESGSANYVLDDLPDDSWVFYEGSNSGYAVFGVTGSRHCEYTLGPFDNLYYNPPFGPADWNGHFHDDDDDEEEDENND
jgi:hypothetical protein